MSEDIKNPFGENFTEAVAGAFVKWTEVGQTVKGVVTDIYEKANDLKGGEMQRIVVVEQEDGTEIQVPLKDNGMMASCKKLMVGQNVGFLFAQVIPSKVKGHQDYKLVKTYLGTLDPDFKGGANTGEVTDEDIAF